MNEHIEEIAKYFISLKPKRMGAVLLPSINGFDVYEFDEDSLRVIIYLLGENSEIKAVTRDKASQLGKEATKQDLMTILIQTGFNIERMFQDKAIKKEAYIVLKHRNDLAIAELKGREADRSHDNSG